MKDSGAKEIRTPDLFNAIEALYQLSYSPREKQRYNDFWLVQSAQT